MTSISYTRCSYSDCVNRNADISMFRYPVNDPERLALWVRNSGNTFMKSLSDKELRCRYICAAHFPPSSIKQGKVRSRLIGSAVPFHFQFQCDAVDAIMRESSPDILKVKIPKKQYSRRTRTSSIERRSKPSSQDSIFNKHMIINTTQCLSRKQLLKSKRTRESLLERHTDHTPEKSLLHVVPETTETGINNMLELVTIKIEPVTEPELVTIKEEPSQSDDEASQSTNPVVPETTEISIKKEPEMITVEIETITEPGLASIKEEPQCDDEASQSEDPSCHESYLPVDIEINSIPVNFAVNDNESLTTLVTPFLPDSSQHSDSSETLDTLIAGKFHTCDVCNKRFALASGLKRHQQSHAEEEPYRCEMCTKEFATLSSLERHKKTHKDEKCYTCEVCQKQFALASRLKRHEDTHRVKPYSCEICKKQFTSDARLNYRQHLRSHMGQKLYSCDVCDKKYGLKAMLDRHKRIHMAGAT